MMRYKVACPAFSWRLVLKENKCGIDEKHTAKETVSYVFYILVTVYIFETSHVVLFGIFLDPDVVLFNTDKINT